VQRLRELGWIEGRTVAIEHRWGEGQRERYVEIAAEFVQLKVDITRAAPANFSRPTGAKNFQPALHEAGYAEGEVVYVPADLPVVQPSRFELAINLRTAKALNLEVPELARPRRRGDRIAIAERPLFGRVG
jgi:hypothetical protein